MFLAETPIFEALSKLLGIPSLALEGGTVVLLAFALIKLIQILFMKEKEDVKQLELSSQLVLFAGRSLEVSEALKTAIENNTQGLRNVETAIRGFVVTIGNQVMPLKDGLDQVRRELISNKKTRVIIKNTAGEIIAEVIAEPVADDTTGEQYLVVQYDVKKSDEPG